jgi:A/G-specific adenine glycosylase
MVKSMDFANSLSPFIHTVRSYYLTHRREMPWRHIEDPYKILVSEIMLQQTQVERVIPKFLAFTEAFPTVFDLARVTPAEVLGQWQGLGYNRRGLFLKRAAEELVEKYNGVVPRDVALVDALPGVGYATACAVVTYSYNVPTVFIETNIRTVFIHHFFADREDVSDSEIEPLVAATVDQVHPRDWYYALMDYGVMLKKEHGNASRKSKHYVKQSIFQGSDRQLRGKVMRYLLKEGNTSMAGLVLLDANREKVQRVVEGMVKDKLITVSQDLYSIVEK